MPRTITQGFQKLKENLEITDLQEATVSTRQKNVRDAVAAKMTVIDSFLTGSYRRSTMIAPLAKADVDVMVVLDASYYDPNGQAALLDKVKRAVKATYPTTPDISRNGQAVTITFTDFIVDVVPAFNRQGGGYLIPDSQSGTWISTDPKEHVRLWSIANSAHDYDLVPLLKMLKGWNRQNGEAFRSFHLEALAVQIFNGITITDFPSGARYFFDKAQALFHAVHDPAGYGGNLAAYVSGIATMLDMSSRLEMAFQRAHDAEELEQRGKTSDAYEKWRLVFGSYFPAYG